MTPEETLDPSPDPNIDELELKEKMLYTIVKEVWRLSYARNFQTIHCFSPHRELLTHKSIHDQKNSIRKAIHEYTKRFGHRPPIQDIERAFCLYRDYVAESEGFPRIANYDYPNPEFQTLGAET